jgi:cGMP-dependent protein kinase
MSTLGVGAFGQVKLVKLRPSAGGKVGPSDPKTYALKCLSKKAIVNSPLQDYVINEKSIMSELEHPFILGFYGTMQDQKYIYSLIESLLGGELFKVLCSKMKY